MASFFAPHVLILVAVLVVLLATIFRTFLHPEIKGATAAAALLFGASLWVVGALLPYLWHDGFVWSELIRLQGTLILPLGWLIFASTYTGVVNWLSGFFRVIVTSIPVLLSLLLWTNAWHQGYWQDLSYTEIGQVIHVEASRGVLYHIHLVYGYTVALLGASMFLSMLWRVAHRNRKYAHLLFLGILLPFMGSVAYQVNFQLFGVQDCTPYLLGVTALAFWFGFDKNRLLANRPIPRDLTLDSMQDGVITVNTGGLVVDINVAASALLKCSPRQMHGKPVRDAFASFPELTGHLHGEHRIEWEHGERTFDVHVSHLRTRESDDAGKLIVFRDITEIKDARDALREAQLALERRVEERTSELSQLNKALVREVNERKQAELEMKRERDRAEEMSRVKSVFLANMSHEIRTPLTGILGFTQILAMEVAPHLQEFVAAIDHSGRRLLDTLTAVLELSRLQAGHVELNPSPFDLIEELEMILDLFQRRAFKKGLELAWDCPDDRVDVVLDRGALNCILQNLLNNAIKFTEEGSVHVRLRIVNDVVVLQVRDTGIGISEAFLPHLFDQFMREQEGINAAYEGSGLGLTLVKHFIDLLDGTIEVESRQPGGTTFTITLPGILEQRRIPKSAQTFDLTAPLPAPDRILVVEDNATTASFIHHLLKEQFVFDIARNADEAHDVWATHAYDIVLMDINLGVAQQDGVSLMREFKAQGEKGAIPFVAMTAYALPGDREKFIAEGFDAYLSKPFGKGELFGLLIELLSPKPNKLIAPDRAPRRLSLRKHSGHPDQPV